MESLTTGTLAGIGSFKCLSCGEIVALGTRDELPPCPKCEGSEFARASLVTADSTVESQSAPEWLPDVRAGLDEPGQYLAFEDGETPVVVPLTREWTRVGRSLAADVRFDDPTVSRRHALVVRQADGVRVLDDRSLNGVFVNGRRVEWSVLQDGDEIVVGRHRLRFVEIVAVESRAAGDPLASAAG